MSSQRVHKKTISKKIKKDPDNKNDTSSTLNVMDCLLSRREFNIEKKNNNEKKERYVEINVDTDSKDKIIEKLVTNFKILKTEFDEYKTYVEGTYCTYAEFNRNYNEIEHQVNDLISKIEPDN
jgi:hypothetical protein